MTLSMMTHSIMTLDIMTFDIMTLDIMTLSMMILRIMTVSIMTLSMMTVSIMTLSMMTLSIMTLSMMTLVKLNSNVEGIHNKPFLINKNVCKKPCFESAFKMKMKKKPKMSTFLGYFIFSKKHYELSKVAQLVKNFPIWSP